MLVAASAIRPAGIAEGKAAWRGDLLLPALLLSGLLALLLLGDLPTWLVFAASAIAAVVLVKFSERRWRVALGGGARLLFVELLSSGEEPAATPRLFRRQRPPPDAAG